MKFPTWLKTVLSFALAGLLAYLSVKDIPTDERQLIITAIKQTTWFWIFLSFVFALSSHISRAMRWKQMLQTFKPVRLSFLFAAQAAGYLVNMALPRVGEATKIGLASRSEKISMDKVVGTAFNDRIIDVIFLFVVTAAAILLEYKIIGNYTLNILNTVLEKIQGLNYLYLVGVGVVTLLIIGLLASKFKLIWQKIKGVLSNIGEGVAALWRVENIGMFIFHSLFIWLMYFLMIYSCMQAMELTADMNASAALVLLAFGTWGFIVTPGGIGAYPIVIAGILELYGKDYNMGIAFGWVIWAAQTLLNLIVGILSIIFLSLNKVEEVKK